MSTEPIALWSTPLYKLDTKTWLDTDEVLTELLVNVPFDESALVELKNINESVIPLTLSALEVQHDRVSECLGQLCGKPLVDLSSSSWMFYSRTGRGLEPHYHSGKHALFTSVLYLTDSLSELVLRDPRGNACRGYDEVLSQHFGSYRIRPKAGELYLFPCYVEHFVATGPDAARLSILTNYSFETKQP